MKYINILVFFSLVFLNKYNFCNDENIIGASNIEDAKSIQETMIKDALLAAGYEIDGPDKNDSKYISIDTLIELSDNSKNWKKSKILKAVIKGILKFKKLQAAGCIDNLDDKLADKSLLEVCLYKSFKNYKSLSPYDLINYAKKLLQKRGDGLSILNSVITIILGLFIAKTNSGLGKNKTAISSLLNLLISNHQTRSNSSSSTDVDLVELRGIHNNLNK